MRRCTEHGDCDDCGKCRDAIDVRLASGLEGLAESLRLLSSVTTDQDISEGIEIVEDALRKAAAELRL